MYVCTSRRFKFKQFHLEQHQPNFDNGPWYSQNLCLTRYIIVYGCLWMLENALRQKMQQLNLHYNSRRYLYTDGERTIVHWTVRSTEACYFLKNVRKNVRPRDVVPECWEAWNSGTSEAFEQVSLTYHPCTLYSFIYCYCGMEVTGNFLSIYHKAVWRDNSRLKACKLPDVSAFYQQCSTTTNFLC